MSSKIKLAIMQFLQFFIWGAWLITFANYWFGTKQWDGTQFGLIFGTMGIASIFMPTLAGVIADRWVNTEKLYGILHLLYAAALFYIPQCDSPSVFFNVMLMAMCFYMPTLALSNSISYHVLKSKGMDVVKDFPPIRVWGTIGFIAAMWVTNLTGNKASENQFYIAGIAALILVVYSFTLPKCKPQKNVDSNDSFFKLLGLDAFKLFTNYKITIFFVFSMFLGAALQLTNAYGDVFLSEFENFPKYADSFVVKYSTIIMSISQISETLFILAIPFFLKQFGIKKVMLISMLAWVLRFAFFAYGDPGQGIFLILLSCVVYGMAFDFFNISGSLFVETSTDPKMRSSAQGLFMMMVNGFGAIIGSVTSGWVIDKFFTLSFTDVNSLSTYLDTTANNEIFLNFLNNVNITVSAQGLLSQALELRDWHNIWITFALYSLVIAILFAILFKHKHVPSDIDTKV